VERDKSAKLAIAEASAKTDALNAKAAADASASVALKAKKIADTQRVRADENTENAIRKSEELQIQLAKTHFQHGVSVYESGRADIGKRDLGNAWRFLPKSHELHASFEQVLWDRRLVVAEVCNRMQVSSARTVLAYLDHLLIQMTRRWAGKS